MLGTILLVLGLLVASLHVLLWIGIVLLVLGLVRTRFRSADPHDVSIKPRFSHALHNAEAKESGSTWNGSRPCSGKEHGCGWGG